MPINTLYDLLKYQLQIIYDNEQQTDIFLSELQQMATIEELKNELQKHLDINNKHIQQASQLLNNLKIQASTQPDQGLNFIINDLRELVNSIQNPEVRLVAIAQSGIKTGYYQIAGYNNAIELANLLNESAIVDNLEAMLTEDLNLTRDFSQLINKLRSPQ